MRAIGIRELKNQLSRYLSLVKRGEIVLVTDRGRVVAQIGPPPALPHASDGDERETLQRLARSGRLELGSGTLPSAHQDLPPTPGQAVDLARLLDDTRADRP